MCRAHDKPNYGEPLAVASGAALLVFTGWLINNWISDFRTYLTAVLYGGVLGAGLELLLFTLPRFWREKNKQAAVNNCLVSGSCFSAGVFLSIIISFFHSAVWESGQLDAWIYGSADYLNWAMCTDYLLGSIDPDSFHLSYKARFMLLYEAIGTRILFALYALCYGKMALGAITAFMVTLVIWTGLSVQLLVRKIFGLGYWTSFMVTLGVIGGSFFNYLIAKGQVGQLAAMFGFLAALTEIYSWSPCQKTVREQTRFFLPVFFIFITYPGGFAPFAVFLILAAGAVHFFTDPQKSLFKKAFQACKSGIKPVFFSLALSALLTPFLTWLVIFRTMQSARQMSGWKISFLSPWLLSGLPVYRLEYFNFLTDPNFSVLLYVPFLAVIFIMGLSVSKLSNTAADSQSKLLNIRLIYSIIFLFTVSILIYIISFYIFDNRYQVWKFISYIGLPLSFVPSALIVSLVIFIKKKAIRCIIIGSIVILAVIFGFGLKNIINLTKMPGTYYNIISATPFLGIMGRIVSAEDPETNFILNFGDPGDMLFAAEIFKNNKLNKFSVMNDSLFFDSNDIFNVITNKNSKYLFITDRKYENMYNNALGLREGRNIYVTTKDWIEEHGYADIFGIGRERLWLIKDNWASARILLPEGLKGKEVEVTAVVRESDQNSKSCLPRAYLGIHGPTLARSGPDFPEITGIAGPELTESGFLKVSVVIEDNSSDSNVCVYFFNKIEVK